MIYFEYKLRGSSISLTDTVRILEITLHTKLYFHPHVDYVRTSFLKLSRCWVLFE
jgi:hypothetical protein